MIESFAASELRPGDVMSTNGARIESVVLCQGGGIPDEIAVCYSFEGGSQRFEYVDPLLPVHVYR